MFDKKIKEVMTAPAACLSKSSTIRDAAQKMRELDIGAIAVCENDRPIGVLTDRDIVVRCVALGHDETRCPVSDAMSREVVTCGPEETIKDAEKLMEERQVRRVLIVDGAGRLLGIVALSDIASADRGMTGRIVEKVTQPVSRH